ncbi:MAG TPA: GNAT family N-acetyltransferase [Candidatus Latescibacteria bacterium]|nr:GNAT family N-acetyltransferase [Candidatus Latescibacterota bacterium]
MGDVEVKREDVGKACVIKLYYKGEHVSGLWVHRLLVHFGEGTVLRMGGIGGVETKEGYRMRGFARRVLEESNRFMEEDGMDVASLFGIRDFYQRWGYAPALPEYKIYLKVDDLSGARLGRELVPYSDEHRRKVVEIYESNNVSRACSVVRSPEVWEGFSKGTDYGTRPVPVVLSDRHGRTCGYLAFDDSEDRTAVSEVGYSDFEVFESLAAAIYLRAKERGHEEAQVAIPPDHPFAVFLRRFGCRAVTTFNRSGGGMMRIVSLGTTLSKLAPELERRLAGSDMAGWEGRFRVRTDIGSLEVEVSGGKVSVARDRGTREELRLPQSKLTQLIVGYRTVDDLASDEDVSVTPSLLPLLGRLFPPLNPYIWWSDRF